MLKVPIITHHREILLRNNWNGSVNTSEFLKEVYELERKQKTMNGNVKNSNQIWASNNELKKFIWIQTFSFTSSISIHWSPHGKRNPSISQNFPVLITSKLSSLHPQSPGRNQIYKWRHPTVLKLILHHFKALPIHLLFNCSPHSEILPEESCACLPNMLRCCVANGLVLQLLKRFRSTDENFHFV